MKTTERFNNAVTKLYTAYHNDTLDAMNCEHCAVGNLCGNSSEWIGTGLTVNNRIDRNFKNKTNYSNIELARIENLFLYGCKEDGNKYRFFDNTIGEWEVEQGIKTKKEQKELQFQGLCAVIEYLAELDNIPNPFNFENLFNDDKETSKTELDLILA